MARISNFTIRITPQACFGAAVMLIAVPLPWILAWFIAAAVHELSHCGALILCGKPIGVVNIGLNGAQIQTGLMSAGQTLLCSLAGPVGGLLLLLTARHFPRLAVCAVLQSAFNLLPVFPLDGGRALRSIAGILFPDNFGSRLCAVIEWLTLGAFLLLGLCATFLWKLGLLPAVLAVSFLLHMKKIKIPCK